MITKSITYCKYNVYQGRKKTDANTVTSVTYKLCEFLISEFRSEIERR